MGLLDVASAASMWMRAGQSLSPMQIKLVLLKTSVEDARQVPVFEHLITFLEELGGKASADRLRENQEIWREAAARSSSA